MRKCRVHIVLASLLIPAIVLAETPRRSSPEQISFSSNTTKAFDRSGKRITVTTLPDGTVAAAHNGTMGHVYLARIGDDGELEYRCTVHEDDARQWLLFRDKDQQSVDQP